MVTTVMFLYQSPFSDLTPQELLEELWEEGINRKFKPPSSFSKDRGNYVASYVLSNLRIQMKSKSTRPKVRVNLEALWNTLPIELVISIFELLHPIDLYHAIRATKGLRCFLLDKNSTAIWKESFMNHPDIPMYPPDVSAPKWASLIFGPATCEVCGTGNCLIEYAFRRRECGTCRKKDYFFFENENMVNAIQPIIGEFRNELNNIRSLCKKVHYLSRFLYPPIVGNEHKILKYSLKEVTERAHEMRKYLLDIQSGIPDAETNYQTFLSIARATMEERMKHVKFCNLWARNILERCTLAFFNSISTFQSKGGKDLLAQQHDPRDVKEAQDIFRSKTDKMNYAQCSDPVLSRSKLRKYFESIVQECKKRRLLHEHDQRVKERWTRVILFYRETTRSVYDHDIARYNYLPAEEKLCTRQFFADYINDAKKSVDELDVSLAQQEISHYIETSWATKKCRLLAILLETGFLPKEATEDSNPDDFLGLAMAVFEEPCWTSSVVFGWRDAGGHIRHSWKKREILGDLDVAESFRFSDIGYQAVKNLAELLHLDLRFALAQDLDALKKRFICKTCSFHLKAGMDGLCPMTWRDCINHAAKSSYSPETPLHVVFDVLTEALTMSLLAADSCFVGLDEHSNHRCLRCPSSRCRLWKRRDLFQHIMDKHGIQSRNLVEGLDWMKIKAVEDDSWIEERMRAMRHRRVVQNRSY